MESISHSENINEFVAALSKAQGVMKPAIFNKKNPHFKSSYADFSSCMDACRLPLSENGIAIVQYCATIEGKLSLVTMLAHTSGQWMKSEFPLIAAKMDSQGIGSAMTYAKRYSLCGMVGIVADEDVQGDDDAEAAQGRGAPKMPNVGQVEELERIMDACPQKFRETVWGNLARRGWARLSDMPLDQFMILRGECVKAAEAASEPV